MGERAMFAIGRAFGAALATLVFGFGVAAQNLEPETRLGVAGYESPPATLDQLDWLVGQWAGEGIQGAPAMESWLAPTGDTMVGTFVQETTDGAIMFTEHMYLMQESGTLALRLKHFNADLTGWEEKDDMLTFRLVAMEPCAVYFNALTLRCADPERPGEGLVAAVRMKSDKPEPQELVFRFTAAPNSPNSYNCDGTSVAINNCLAAIREKAEEREEEYFQAAIGNHGDSDELDKLMRASHALAKDQRENECNAIYEFWKEGSIRDAMSLRCSIRLIDQRTHDIWRNWLTYQDSSAPILPEPEPSR
ncbi:MAG: DUF6265 family protein [Pseudomonadota bacterium]